MAKTLVVEIEGNKMIATDKVFSSGSTGFYATGKIVIDGEQYQVSLPIVKVGSKPKS